MSQSPCGSGDLSYVSPNLRSSTNVTKAFFGSSSDQYELANCFLEGANGFPKDSKRGVYWLTQAVNGGDLCALNQLGLCYLSGEGVMKNEEVAFRMIRLSADKGLVVGMINTALLAANGRGISVDFPLAAEFLLRASQQGSADATNQLGQFYLRGWGVAQDPAKAFQYFQKAADEGAAGAAANLAQCFEEGIGTSVDFAVARKHWIQGALNNDAVAARCVGERFLVGARGFPVDAAKARRYFLRGAEGGDAQAQYQLAQCLNQAIGGPPDSKARVMWLEKAAAQNLPEAIAEMGDVQIEEKILEEQISSIAATLSTQPVTVKPSKFRRFSLREFSFRSKEKVKKPSLLQRIFHRKRSETI